MAKMIVESFGGVSPGGGLDAVAVHVLAGQMQHDPLPAVGDQSAEPVGRKHRPAAGIVGDRNPADPAVAEQILGESGQIAGLVGRFEAAGGDHLDAVIEPLAGEHLLERSRRRWSLVHRCRAWKYSTLDKNRFSAPGIG